MRHNVYLAVFLLTAPLAWTQGVGSELIGGKLIEPSVGQWAWYDLEDVATKNKYAVRQAIVAKERVERKDAYWLEIEIVPELGYKSVIKTLMVEPDYDLASVVKMVFKSGLDPAVEVAHDQAAMAEEAKKPKRTSMGKETVETGSGAMKAERFRITNEEGESTVWISDDVHPTGIVRMESPNGQLRLRNFGVGGVNAKSVIEEKVAPRASDPEIRVEVKGGKE